MLTECPTKQISLIDTRYPFTKQKKNYDGGFSKRVDIIMLQFKNENRF